MNLTGVAMETMRPSGPAKLSEIETDIYKEVVINACCIYKYLALHCCDDPVTFNTKKIPSS